jgi:hypothetical protein
MVISDRMVPNHSGDMKPPSFDVLIGLAAALSQAWLVKHTSRAFRPEITRHISRDPDNADAALLLLGIAAPNPARAEFGKNRSWPRGPANDVEQCCIAKQLM